MQHDLDLARRRATAAIDPPGHELALAEVDCLALSLVACSPHCVKVLNLDGGVLLMSDAGKCAMGIEDFESFRGQSYPRLWPPEARRRLEALVAAAGEGRPGHFVGSCLTLTGRFRVWDVTLTPIFATRTDGRRAVSLLLAVSRDVTGAWRSGAVAGAMIHGDFD